jgi:hypothetical protein
MVTSTEPGPNTSRCRHIDDCPSWFLGTIRLHAANELWIEGIDYLSGGPGTKCVWIQEELNRALTIHGFSYLFLIEIQGAQVALRNVPL